MVTAGDDPPRHPRTRSGDFPAAAAAVVGSRHAAPGHRWPRHLPSGCRRPTRRTPASWYGHQSRRARTWWPVWRSVARRRAAVEAGAPRWV